MPLNRRDLDNPRLPLDFHIMIIVEICLEVRECKKNLEDMTGYQISFWQFKSLHFTPPKSKIDTKNGPI